jgi:nitroreductase
MHNDDTARAVLDVIRQRRSTPLTQLQPEPVPSELIWTILEAASWAPNHGRTEPWRFTVFTGEARRQLGELFAEAVRESQQDGEADESILQAQRDKVWKAPVWIAVSLNPSTKVPEWEQLAAVAAAMQNAQLAATSLGLATKWTTGAYGVHPAVARGLGLEPPEQLLGFLHIGYPSAPSAEGKRSPIGDKVRWFGELA